MYQWRYSETPTTSLSLTPSKLDRLAIWPQYNTKPIAVQHAAAVSIMPSHIKEMAPTNAAMMTVGLNYQPQVLRKHLLNCANIDQLHAIVNDWLPATTPFTTETSSPIINADDMILRCGMKHTNQMTEVLNNDNRTINEYNQCINNSESTKVSHEVGTQTESTILIANVVCASCGQCNAKPLPPYVPPPAPPPPPPAPPQATKPPPPPTLPILTKLPPPPPPPPPPPNAGPSPLTSLQSATVVPSPPTSLLTLNTTPGTAKSPNALSTPTPAPLPNPSECGWFNQVNTLRKIAVNPPKPMKPLYWTRIVTAPPPSKPITQTPSVSTKENNTNPSESSTDDAPDGPNEIVLPKEIWQEIDETLLDNIDEFTELFSRQAVIPVNRPKEQHEVRVKTMKVLDSKRSQNVGILSRSLHVDFCEIEHAIYHVDTSVVSLETLQHIINIKATPEELELIKEAAQCDIPLDHPEQFLLKIAQISMSTERISCIVFQAEFDEACTLIARKLEVVMQLSQYLIESEDLKLVFSIILTLGNYMNGGNRQRGQADGFTLEILGKLKDVKSKDSHTTLLHFIVRTYINCRRKEGIQLLEMTLPIPEPSDVERADQVDFDEVKLQITELNKKLNICIKTTEKVVIESTANTLQPFQSKMDEFIEGATKIVEKLHKDLNECRELFIDTMRFYHFTPKSRTIEQCTPNQFYEYWTNFTNDFKDIWKKEISLLYEELMKKTKQIQSQTRKNVKTIKLKPGGLKERILRLSKK